MACCRKARLPKGPPRDRQATHGRPEREPKVTPKPHPERNLAIALENLTPEAVADLARQQGGAPRITASGRGAVAEQILQIAFERGVKVRSDSDLAEILAAVEVESEIPLAALAAVAEILRYLYQTDGRQTDGRQPEGDAAAGKVLDEEK